MKRFTKAPPQENPDHPNAPPIYIVEGNVTKEEMLSFLNERGNQANVALVDTTLPDGRKGKVTKEGLHQSMKEFIDKLYFDRVELPLQHLVNLKRDMRDEILDFEVEKPDTSSILSQ